jgi:hypothetical protein
VTTILLNGASVVRQFAEAARVELRAAPMREWDLPRNSGRPIPGVAFEGRVETVGGVALEKQVRILGWNHNLQSSYGVTAGVIESIGSWVGSAVGAGSDPAR